MINLAKLKEELKKAQPDPIFNQVMYIFTRAWEGSKVDFERISEEALNVAFDHMANYVSLEEWENEKDDQRNAQNLFERWYVVMQLKAALVTAPPKEVTDVEFAFI